MRDIGAKSTAKNVLNMNKESEKLSRADLDSLNRANPTNAGVPSEAGRSIKSEYDYGSKRKFVDVLGNF